MIIILYVSKGVYEQCNGNLSDALLCFNNARYSKEWGAEAIEQMIEIYLFIDDIDFWSAVRNSEKINVENLQSAEILLSELDNLVSDKKKYKTLLAYSQLQKACQCKHESSKSIQALNMSEVRLKLLLDQEIK